MGLDWSNVQVPATVPVPVVLLPWFTFCPLYVNELLTLKPSSTIDTVVPLAFASAFALFIIVLGSEKNETPCISWANPVATSFNAGGLNTLGFIFDKDFSLNVTVVTGGIEKLIWGATVAGFTFKLGKVGAFIFIDGSIIKGCPLSGTGTVPTSP